MKEGASDDRSRGQIRGKVISWPLECGEWGSCELELDDSPGSDVWALSNGRGWVRDGREDPVLVLYLRGTRAVGTGAGDTALVVVGGELCPVAGGGEEGRTRGLKMYPPRVLAMPG